MQAPPASFGADFGRGLAASAAAAGGGVPPVAPVPHSTGHPVSGADRKRTDLGGGRGRPGFSADTSASAGAASTCGRDAGGRYGAVWVSVAARGIVCVDRGGFDAGASVDPELAVGRLLRQLGRGLGCCRWQAGETGRRCAAIWRSPIWSWLVWRWRNWPEPQALSMLDWIGRWL